MRQQGLTPQRVREISPIRKEFSEVFEHIQRVSEQIARRAFEIFEHGGRKMGHDLANWFQAETELLHPVHLDISESTDSITVRAEVPGFTTKDLEISIEPRRVTITGKREAKEERKTKRTIYSEHCSNQILRMLDLPSEVDPERIEATLRDGILELEMQKAAPAKKVRIEPKGS